MPPDEKEQLRRAVQLMKAGQQSEAKKLVADLLRTNPQNADGWYLASLLTDDASKKRALLERALAVNPQHAQAQKALAGLRSEDRHRDSRTSVLTGAIVFVALVIVLVVVVAIGRSQGGVALRASETPALASAPSTASAVTRTSQPTVDIAQSATALAVQVQTAVAGGAPTSGAITPLNFEIADAEYSAALDRIIAISENPNQLHIYDPNTQSDAVINLERLPSSVSVSPDGLMAAVGHSALISYVDLQNQQIVKTMEVSLSVKDLVLAGNGWIYITGLKGETTYLNEVEIATGSEREGADLFGDAFVIQLHPSGLKLYGAERGISPPNIARVDIGPEQNDFDIPSNWVPYSSPYFDDYRMCGDVWLSQDGGRIFTACGNVFRATDDQATDMTYVGSLEDMPVIRHLTHSQAAGLILGLQLAEQRDYAPVSGLSENVLGAWDDETLATQTIITLPDFVVNDQAHTANGRFVFANAAGTHYYVIAQADGFGDFGLLVGDLPIAVPAEPIQTVELPVSEGPVQLLNFQVVDAEYSAALDRIIAVSASPNLLHIYDANGQNDVPVALSRRPTSVSIAPDGLFAAVGHDGSVSYVDLQNAQVVDTLPVSMDVWDIVLSSDGWIYVTPPNASSQSIIAVEIASGNQVEGPNISGRIMIRLHPGGYKLYGTTVAGGSGDQGMIRVDIGANGYVTDAIWPGSSSYIFVCRNLWPSDDGQRVFTACGNVYRTSDNPEQDMTENGTLDGVEVNSEIRSLAFSQETGLILALPLVDDDTDIPLPENQLLAWDYNTLAPYDPIILPDFVLDSQPYTANGRYVFMNPSGGQYYAIVQTVETDKMPGYFGVMVDTLPMVSVEASVAAESLESEGPITQLDFRVRDAEYSLSLDRIIAISETPSQLHIYDPETNTDVTVDLLDVPTSVSVGPDGLFAAVGYQNAISYVDLQNAEVVITYSARIDVVDIVLAANGWIYFTPPPDMQHDAVHAIEISTGSEVQGPTVYGGVVIRLHPDGRKLYVADRYTGPADIERVDFGPVPFDPEMRNPFGSPYHGEYDMCGNLWFSQDGARIFTACGAVFHSSNDPQEDMIYEMTMEGLPAISHLAHSEIAGFILAVPQSQGFQSTVGPDLPENLLGIWNADDLTNREVTLLPNWDVNGQLFMSNGRFVFVNAEGTRYYVIVQAGGDSGLRNDFGVVVGELPNE